MKDQLAGARCLQPDADLLVVRGRRQPLQPVEFCLAAARLSRALAGFVAADELFRAGDIVPLCFVLFLPYGPPFPAQSKVLPVIPGVPLARAGLQLEDVVGGVLEEPTVVRHDEHARRRQAQKSFQPFDRFKIQVVGRLVEEKQVGVLKQQPGEGQPAPLPPAERAWRQCLVGFGQADPMQDFGDPVVIRIAVEALVFVLDFAVFLNERRQSGTGRTGQSCLQPGQPLPQPNDVRPAV